MEQLINIRRCPVRSIIFLALIILVLTGCGGSGVDLDNRSLGIGPVSGTVRYIDLEGGFYGIVVDDKTAYEPQNLAPEFQQDGLLVRFSGLRINDGSSLMWGIPLKITSIEKIQDGNTQN